jgi:hypothetical protein
MRQHTGTIQLFADGQRPQPKDAGEILRIAQGTQFFEDGRVEVRLGPTATIAFVPRQLIQHGTREAFTQGLLVYKFTVAGTPPPGSRLTADTYYFFLDFVGDRWVGRIVNSSARVMCVKLGIQVKETVAYHLDVREDHSRPQIVLHQIGVGLDASDWADVQINWVPFGAGCWKDIVCVPGPSQ